MRILVPIIWTRNKSFSDKKNIIFIGTIDDKGIGTAFLLRINDIHHLITAKHVITKQENGVHKLNDDKLRAFFHDKGGKIINRSFKDIKSIGVNWLFHKDSIVDIAMIPFPLNEKSDDFAVIPQNLFLPIEELHETYDVVFISYQNRISQINNLSPIFRTGMLSIINTDKTFYIDGNAFPGNSGSPVFLKPAMVRYNKSGGTTTTIGADPVGGKFIGIVGEYETYSEIAISSQTGRPRILFEENTGLTKVWSVNYIAAIIDSPDFKQQLDKIKK